MEKNIPRETEFVLLPKYPAGWLQSLLRTGADRFLFWGRRKPHCFLLQLLLGVSRRSLLFSRKGKKVGFNLEVEQHSGEGSLTELMLSQVLSLTS